MAHALEFFFFTCSLFIRAWHLFTSLTWTQPCSKHLLQVTPCNLRKMEIRLSKIPYTNPFIIPQSVLKEICLFRNYANTCTWMHVHRTTFERNSSLGYHHLVWKWENKTHAEKVYCPISGPHSWWSYRKIPKISPGTYIFQRPFLKGLFLEGLIYRGKFAFQNRLC